jgi:hypothetical protein
VLAAVNVLADASNGTLKAVTAPTEENPSALLALALPSTFTQALFPEESR